MAFITTNPSPYILNLPELQNVVTSATGASASLQTSVENLLTYLDTTNASLSINTITTNTGTVINFGNSINLSNASMYINGSNSVTSNSINGTPYLAVTVADVEEARFTPTGLGIGKIPTVPLDVVGNAVISGTLYASTIYGNVQSLGDTVVSGTLYISSVTGAVAPLGDIYAEGDLHARGLFYPSDPSLKQNIRPYTISELPTPVAFEWRSGTQESDIGFIASEIAEIEPRCVKRSPGGLLSVDYAKMVVLCMAECRTLRDKVQTLEIEISRLSQSKHLSP